MKIIFLLLFIFPMQLMATSDVDTFECGEYELNGKVLEGDGKILKFKMYPSTKKEYVIKVKGPYVYNKKLYKDSLTISKIRVISDSKGLATVVEPMIVDRPQAGSPIIEKTENFKLIKKLNCKK